MEFFRLWVRFFYVFYNGNGYCFCFCIINLLRMIRKLYPLVLLLPFLSSCTKWLPENRIEGSWVLTEVQKRRPFANETLYSPYQNGTFLFFSNGNAVYSDSFGTMQGDWQMRNVNDQGYYDSEGQWQSGTRTVLWVRLIDFSTNRVIDWYFDRFDFRTSGNRLVGFMDSPSYNYRYTFRRKE